MAEHTDSGFSPPTLGLLRELSAAQQQALLALADPLSLDADHTLYRDGDPYQHAIYIFREGAMTLTRGEQRCQLQAGDVLGLESYLDQMPYTASVVTHAPSRLECIDANRLQSLAIDHPALFDTISRLISEGLRRRFSHRQPVTGVWSLPARTLMKAPLATCRSDLSVRDAFRTMRERQMGSLGIVTPAQELIGIITYATLAEGLIERGAHPDDPVDRVFEPAHIVDPDIPLWKVQSEQERHRAKYLVVVEGKEPVGVISQSDILETLVSYQRSVIVEIANARSISELQAFHSRLGTIARELSQHNRRASLAIRALSEVHLAIQRRCVDLVLSEMLDAGLGEPPFAYALIIMGSGGRREMLINTDQDNGLILAEEPDEAEARWFEDFAERVNRRLDEVGYTWCPGDIMARNPEFHKSLEAWCLHLSRIAKVPTEKTARWSTIFFDFETLHGDDSLGIALRNHLLSTLKTRPRLLRLMVEDDATGSPALGLFNRLVTASDKERKGRIDLKRNGTRILVDFARIYALADGIEATNSGDRLQALLRQGRLAAPFIDAALAAYDELLDITLSHQLRQWQQGEAVDKLVKPEELTPLEEQSLRAAMRVVKRLQGQMQGDFGTVLL